MVIDKMGHVSDPSIDRKIGVSCFSLANIKRAGEERGDEGCDRLDWETSFKFAANMCTLYLALAIYISASQVKNI